MIEYKKLDNFFFLTFLVISFISSYFFKNNLENNQALGTHTFVLFVPWFLYLIYHVVYNIEFRIYKYLLFIIISFLPIFAFISNEIFHLIGDDSNVYSIHANHMINNFTLNGNVLGGIFEDQPGYPYFLAAEIIIFGKQTRGMQLFNIFIFFLFYLYFIKKFTLHFKEKNIILIILVLCLPYSIKNILFTYNEWLCVLFLIFFYLAFKSERYYLSLIFLSLLPFIRQNLLIISLILFFVLLFNLRSEGYKKLFSYCLIYFLILLLPVYHNFYYGGQLTYFVSARPFNAAVFNSLTDLINPIFYFNNFGEIINLYKDFFEKIFLLDGRKLTNLLISLFVPIMTIYFIYLIIIEKNNFIKLILIFFTVSVFYPTIFLGHLAPPRFEYVNLFSVYIMYPLIRNLKLR